MWYISNIFDSDYYINMQVTILSPSLF